MVHAKRREEMQKICLTSPTASVGQALPQIDEFVGREANIFRDLSNEHWRDVAAAMVWHGCATSIGMPELFMRSPLPDFDEAQGGQDGDHLARAQRRYASHHGYATSRVCVPTNSVLSAGSPSSSSICITS